MAPFGRIEALDRHALVMAVWLAFGLLAAALLHFGLGAGGLPATLAGFAALAAAFVGHVIINAVLRTHFSARELALGLVGYGVALIAFGLALLLGFPGAHREILGLSIGFTLLPVMVIFYLITHFGVRRAFDAFDAIRDFRPSRGAGGTRMPGEGP